MRIALVVPGGVDRSGERRVIPALVALVRRLATRHELHVYALRQEPRAGEWVLHGATVHNLGDPSPGPRCCLAVVRAHRAAPFDVVHAVFGGSVGCAAVAAARAIARPSLVHVAGGELVALDDIGYGGARRYATRVRERWTLRAATVVTAASAPILAQIVALGVRAHRVPLGVDRDGWPASPPRRRPPGAPARLVHVASLNAVKDQATLLRAVARLVADGVPLHLDVVGEDTLGGRVQALARDLGVEAHVAFHGFLTQRESRALVERADLNVISSRHEAGPLVVLEAAVAGVPTVGTAVGHVAEWAPDAAVAVPCADPAALAAAIARVLADEPFRLSLAAAAQRRALAEDATHTAAAFERLYGSAIAARTE